MVFNEINSIKQYFLAYNRLNEIKLLSSIKNDTASVISDYFNLKWLKTWWSSMILSNTNIKIFLCSVKLNRAERAKILILPMFGADPWASTVKLSRPKLI
jgi:hypothetical protein